WYPVATDERRIVFRACHLHRYWICNQRSVASFCQLMSERSWYVSVTRLHLPAGFPATKSLRSLFLMRKFFSFCVFGFVLFPGLNHSAQNRTIEADTFPGTDLGARINAADRALGQTPGEIVARRGGKIATQIVISKDHTLRLMSGTYSPVTRDAPILL